MGGPVSRKDEEATRLAGLLGIRYTHAVRLIRQASKEMAEDAPFSDLAHACRAIKEEEENRRKTRPKGALPKGAGRVFCMASDKCDATAAADGMGSPIVLKHDDGCPDKYPIKGHPYDAGYPRDDSNGCIATVLTDEDGMEWQEDCGRPLSEHAQSEYPEDGR